jgi:diketogulonate reductase-like aldo/keto reductase
MTPRLPSPAQVRRHGSGTGRLPACTVGSGLWNTNHRPERVKPAFDASRRRLQLEDVDC